MHKGKGKGTGEKRNNYLSRKQITDYDQIIPIMPTVTKLFGFLLVNEWLAAVAIGDYSSSESPSIFSGLGI